MAKTAKSATAKSAAKSATKTRDLFAELPASPAHRTAARAKTAARTPARGSAETGYTAKHIEVLEGLEPVRRRPGMYIGGTDEKALHHLFAEVIDNAMDEALAGHADFIEVEMEADGFVTVNDNGRGIPVDPHPKFKNKSALEVIMTHAACRRQIRFRGLRDLGRPARRRRVGRQRAVGAHGGRGRARAASSIAWRSSAASRRASWRKLGRAPNRRGTKVRFRPDPEIFGAKAHFRPERIVQDDALQGLSVRRRGNPLACAPELLRGVEDVPEKATFHFADGLKDYLSAPA